MDKKIRIRGAREHNLKNINLTLPRDSLTVITGLSGSGKSSLAFDTIYAEGQRRYVESLSAYARQFLELMEKPNVDAIDGLSPAIAIDQKTTARNPRSTVGTVTEIYDYMRLLFARVGIPYSPATGLPIESQSVSQMVDGILTNPEQTRLYLIAPLIRGRKGEYRKEIADLMKRGFQRLKVDGEIYQIEEIPKLDKKRNHTIEVIVDRLVIGKDISARLADSVETALELSDGLLVTENADNKARTTYSARYSCPVSGFSIDEIEPRLFSFNNPFGACPHCDGIGTINWFDPDLIVPDAEKTLRDGAIYPWTNKSTQYYQQALEGVASFFGFSVNKRFKDLTKKERDLILHGSGTDIVPITYDDGIKKYTTKKPFEGVIPNLDRRLNASEHSWIKDELSRFQTELECKQCQGFRLKQEALAVKISELQISEVADLSILEASRWFSKIHENLSATRKEIAERILKEINLRLGFLIDVGLEYLTLSRKSATLSGGESQRIRLASQIGSGLTGVLYVLDEPSIGLHQRDNARLLKTLRHLRDLGNTVLMVEHDEEAIMAADYVVDIGPGAGLAGGKVVAVGTPADIIANPKSITGQYLARTLQIPVPSKRRKKNSVNHTGIRLIGASANNLQEVNVTFPIGTFICVTGVSGSGKSSLVVDTLFRAAARQLNRARSHPGPYKEIKGLEHIDKVVDINQSPIGRTPRSNPATYTGCFTPIRDWYSGLPEAKSRGYKPGRFSFNVKGGRCEACQGEGVLKVEMHFLPDIYVTCDQCRGARYNRETLEITYRNNSIAKVLDMSVDEAANLFEAIPSIRDKLVTLQKVGLGYVKVGQPATTLSGGEAQRVKLAKELAKRATGKTLYILDEPTTGLHFEDVRKLLEVLHTLVDAGNTVAVIEHNLEVIKTADWIIDMGPEGGAKGGQVVVTGTPESVARTKNSYTGQYLKHMLGGKGRSKTKV